MSKEKKRSGMAVFNKANTLFKYPMIEEMLLTGNDLPELFKKTQDLKDHRLLAVVTALIVEDRIDKILSSLLPKYKILKKNAGFSFSTKIDLLESFNLIPKQIIKSANILRKIRNDFAHDLKKESFIDVDSALIKNLRDAQENYFPLTRKEDKKNDQISSSYDHLAKFCIICLSVYRGNVRRFTEKIYSEEFIKDLLSEVEEHFANAMQASKDIEPS